MNVHVVHDTKQIRLQKAWLLYGNRNGIEYVSEHPVKIDPSGRAEIEAGAALTMPQLESLIAQVQGNRPLTLMDDRVLAYNGEKLVFWVPAQRRATWMHCDEPFGRRHGTVWHPACVFARTRMGLSVFCVDDRRPHAGTPLWHSPYLNVGESGSVCMGDRQLPKAGVEHIDAIADAFFTSEFTHTNRSHVVHYSGGSYALWADLLAGKFPDAFPMETLLPAQQREGEPLTLGQWLTIV